jgi:glycosyltransferase involved in cell wall biosynthesis
MKILYIYNLYQQPGGENQWVEREPELMRGRGHEVLVYKRDNNEISQFSLPQRASLLWSTAWSERTYLEVRELVRRERPCVAHVHNTLPLVTPSVYYACGEESVPVVQTLHNYRLLCPAATFVRDGHVCEECIEHSLGRSVRHGCYRNSRVQSAAVAWMLYSHRQRGTWQECIDAYLVPTEFMRQKFIEGGLPTERIVVTPNFHDPDPGLREESDGSALYTGRLVTEKGLRALTAAWKRLENPPRLVIIGDGPLREELERAARLSRGRIEVLGQRSHAEVIAHLKKAAFVVLPSEWYEGSPQVILEAYACGVPILASRIGALAEMVRDGVTGLLFEPGQPADLAARVRWMAAHEDEARRLGLNGRRAYESKYTAERNYERLMAIYNAVIEGKICGLVGAVREGEEQPAW